MSYPKALQGDPKVIFFTDFDGTITLQDTNDFLVDTMGMGHDPREVLDKECLEGKKTFRQTVPRKSWIQAKLPREIFVEMLDSVKHPFQACIDQLRANISLDPHFKEFHDWARANGVPVIVLSSGMEPIIRTLLSKLLGPEADDLDIICNESVPRPGMTTEQPGGWTVKFHDDSGFGHDKSLTIRPYAKHFDERPNEHRPALLFAGDGVSDLSAARETDLLFAKKGRDLVTYCEREGLPFTVFEDWSSILAKTKEIFDGKKTLRNDISEDQDEAKKAA